MRGSSLVLILHLGLEMDYGMLSVNSILIIISFWIKSRTNYKCSWCQGINGEGNAKHFS
jgi:hypothetical protein